MTSLGFSPVGCREPQQGGDPDRGVYFEKILWPPCEIEAGRWQSVRKRVEQEESWPLSSAYPEKAH